MRAEQAAQAPQKARQGARQPWVVRIPETSIDARANPVGHRVGWMLVILEKFCRDRCYTWVGNAVLAAAYGCSENALLVLLKEMESGDAPFIVRVPTERGRPGRPGRVGIILLRRLNPDLPIAEPADVRDVIRLMQATKRKHQDRARGQLPLALTGPESDPKAGAENCAEPPPKTGASDPRKRGALRLVYGGHDDPRKRGAEESRSRLEHDLANNDAAKEDAPTGGDPEILERQRPETPEESPASAPEQSPPPPPDDGCASALSEAARPTPVEPPPLAPSSSSCRLDEGGGEAPKTQSEPPNPLAGTQHAGTGLVEGERAFLEWLTPEQLAVFATLPHEDRDRILSLHTKGFHRLAAKIEAAKLVPVAELPPPPVIPRTTEERLEQLPGAPAHWPKQAAEALVQDFGNARDRKLWRAFAMITHDVWTGRCPVEVLLHAYRKAMEPHVKNPGAYFNTTLQDQGWSWEDD